MRTLSISLIVVALVATIGLSWLFDTYYQSYQQSENSQPNDTVIALEDIAVNLANSIAVVSDPEQFIEQWQDGYQLQLINTEQMALPKELVNALDAGKPLTLQSDEQVTIHVRVPGSDQLLLLAFEQLPEPSDKDTHRYWLTSLFYLLLIGVFIVWLTPLLLRLLKLREAAQAFGEGHLDQRIEVGSISYIKDVESEFNHMAQRIEDLVSDVKLLSSAVSHDLRTPLAKLRMGIDTLREESDEKVREKYHQRLDTQLDCMVELVETLLQYARLDQVMINLEKQSLDMSSVVSSCIDQHHGSMVYTNTTCQQQCIIDGDPRYLKIAINNLLQNATKYGNGTVHVTLTETEEYYAVSVEDNGSGIPPQLHTAIFKPFVRGDHQETKGFGVGLAMVKRVLDWHQGSISVCGSPTLGGAKFELRLKK